MTILLISASVRGDTSLSRTLSQKLINKFADTKIIERDLTKEIDFISTDSLAAVGTPKDERTTEQINNETAILADALIKELQDADTIIIGAPIYNFGPPASLKAWADLVARAKTTFHYTENGPEGLLKDKKAYVIAVSGGTKIGSDIDFMSPWLLHFLGFIGITDIEMIIADGIFGQDGEEKIKTAHEHIENISV